MTDENKIGYGRPPKQSRFKPGRSGNPNGRPKGAKNLKTDLAAELNEQVVIHEGAHSKKVSKQRAMLKSLMAKALSGDVGAIAKICGLVERLLLPGECADDDPHLSPDDQLILERFKARHATSVNKGGGDA